MVRGGTALLLVIAAACQGSGGEVAPRVETGSGSGSGSARRDGGAFAAEPHVVVPTSGSGSASGSNHDPIDRGAKDTPTKPDEPELPDPGKAIDALGAIPAWDAVIGRADLLARRGQHGVAYGRLGPIIMVPPVAEAGFGNEGGPVTEHADAGVPVKAGSGSGSGSAAAPPPKLVESPYHWLIDDSDGNGSLAIRVLLGTKTAKEGDRVALGGAWVLDSEHRWFWKVDDLTALPPAAPSDVKDPPPAAPGHAIANGELPSGARTMTLARDNDAVYFQIVGPQPGDDADGWAVANQLGDPVFAILRLPGERPAYGAQDMRGPDEHWALRRGQTYWVRIGQLHRHGPDKPITINARTPPVRVL